PFVSLSFSTPSASFSASATSESTSSRDCPLESVNSRGLSTTPILTSTPNLRSRRLHCQCQVIPNTASESAPCPRRTAPIRTRHLAERVRRRSGRRVNPVQAVPCAWCGYSATGGTSRQHPTHHPNRQ